MKTSMYRNWRCRWWRRQVTWRARPSARRTCFAWPIYTRSYLRSRACCSRAFPPLYWCWSRAPSGTVETWKTPTRCQSDSVWRSLLLRSRSDLTQAAAWTRPGHWHQRSGTISGHITGSTGSAPLVAPFYRPSCTKLSSAWRTTRRMSAPLKLSRWTASTFRRRRYDRYVRVT